MHREEEASEEQERPSKRPYVTPCVEESGSFETLVLSCAFEDGDYVNCGPSSPSS